MPYVETGSLRDRLAGGVLPVGQVVQVAGEVASALGYAHALGVIHRDLKPENILLTITGHALVSDFGIAYALEGEPGEPLDGRLTETGLTVGTPAYMSPEQSAGDEQVDGRSDIYALAAVVFEALSGTPPITGPNARTIIARRLTEPPPSILSLRPDVPPAIDRALAQALSRRPEDRFQSVEEFARALEGKDDSVAAPPAPPPSRPSSKWRRASVAALVALVLAGASLWYARATHLFPSEMAHEQMRVLVVLPFKNLGPAADQYFADGLTEELTSRLAGLSGLRVISRTSADQYRSSGKSLKAIGAELGAGYVLEGSVRWERAGPGGGPGRIRVTPQLIQVRDDSHLWSRVYEEELTGVFGVQSAIAEQVTTALDVALRAPERAALAAGGTRQPEAYDFYLRGLDYLNRSNQAGDLKSAADLFTEAVTVDPGFAQAQARLARASASLLALLRPHRCTAPGSPEGARCRRGTRPRSRGNPHRARFLPLLGRARLRGSAQRVRERAPPAAEQRRAAPGDRLRRAETGAMGAVHRPLRRRAAL